MFNPKHLHPSEPADQAGFMYGRDSLEARRHWRMSVVVVVLTAVAIVAAALTPHLYPATSAREAEVLPHAVMHGDAWTARQNRS